MRYDEKLRVPRLLALVASVAVGTAPLVLGPDLPPPCTMPAFVEAQAIPDLIVMRDQQIARCSAVPVGRGDTWR
jgi:hypothetical protein